MIPLLICFLIKKLNPKVIILFIRCRKRNISLIFIAQSYFATRLHCTQYFIVTIPNKREFQQIAFNHSSEIGFRGFIYLYKTWTAKPYYFLSDATLASDNLYVLERIF